jgi:MinD-like ATPase involved in chromosome partitioning or flagellar assembly
VSRKLEVPNLYLVVNKALSSYDFDDLKKRVEETYSSPVAAILPLSEDVARMQSADLFSLRYPDHVFSEGIRNIVAAIEAAE